MLAVLALGTIYFWLFLLLVFILITCLVENDHGGLATLSVLSVLAVFYWVYHFNPFSWVINNPGIFILYILAYIGAGVTWCYFKWTLYVYGQAARAKHATRTDRIYRDGVEVDVPVDQDGRIDDHPQVSAHASKLLGWMTYWPFSAAWTLTNDPVRRCFRYLFNLMKNSLQAISDRAYASIKKA